MNLVDVQAVIRSAMRHVRRSLTTTAEALVLAPELVRPSVLKSVDQYKELVCELTTAAEVVADAVAQLAATENQLDLNFRRQKMWRLLGCRACIGGANIEDLIHQAFYDFIRDPPSHKQLDAELHEMVERLKELEQAAAEFGTLRSIVLD